MSNEKLEGMVIGWSKMTIDPAAAYVKEADVKDMQDGIHFNLVDESPLSLRHEFSGQEDSSDEKIYRGISLGGYFE